MLDIRRETSNLIGRVATAKQKSEQFSKTTLFENCSPHEPKFLSEAAGRGWEFEEKMVGLVGLEPTTRPL